MLAPSRVSGANDLGSDGGTRSCPGWLAGVGSAGADGSNRAVRDGRWQRRPADSWLRNSGGWVKAKSKFHRGPARADSAPHHLPTPDSAPDGSTGRPPVTNRCPVTHRLGLVALRHRDDLRWVRVGRGCMSSGVRTDGAGGRWACAPDHRHLVLLRPAVHLREVSLSDPPERRRGWDHIRAASAGTGTPSPPSARRPAGRFGRSIRSERDVIPQ